MERRSQARYLTSGRSDQYVNLNSYAVRNYVRYGGTTSSGERIVGNFGDVSVHNYAFGPGIIFEHILIVYRHTPTGSRRG